MTGAPWYIRNDYLHQDLRVETAKQIIGKLATSYEKRLHRHPNTLAIRLLEALPVSRLKRKTPVDLVAPRTYSNDKCSTVKTPIMIIIV